MDIEQLISRGAPEAIRPSPALRRDGKAAVSRGQDAQTLLLRHQLATERMLQSHLWAERMCRECFGLRSIAEEIQRTVSNTFRDAHLQVLQRIAQQGEEFNRIANLVVETPSAIVRELNSQLKGSEEFLRGLLAFDVWKVRGPVSIAELGCEQLHEFLLEHSWALPVGDGGMDLIFELSDLLEIGGQTENLENTLEAHFSNRIDEIERTLATDYPHRARLLKQAFNAHRRGEFGLSIPAFFAQIDGIWNDIADESFFRRNGAKGRIEALLANRDVEEAVTILAEALEQCGGLKLHSDHAADRPHVLSRHAVMHGVSVYFDTKRNSLKCISWLALLASVGQETC